MAYHIHIMFFMFNNEQCGVVCYAKFYKTTRDLFLNEVEI